MVRLRSRATLADTLRSQARVMRKAPTPAEERLWEALRNRKRGAKFRRQRPIDRFVVDFYCSEARLIVELDGEIHLRQAEADAVRQSDLERLGLRVLRFANEEVLDHLPAVLICIERAVREQMGTIANGPHPRPLSRKRERGGAERRGEGVAAAPR